MRVVTAFAITVLSVIAIILIINFLFENTYKNPKKIQYGVSFSPNYAKYLGLDWQKTYLQILNELKVKNLRIPTFWDVLEKEEGKLDFSQVDFMLDEAKKAQAKVILVVGTRQPRWPECHIPSWAKKLSVESRKKELLQLVRTVVERYENNPAIAAWQVENEPLLQVFGEGCDQPDKNFLREEVELVRSLSDKTVILTDSGELGLWVTSMRLSDVFGTTLYRQVYDRFLRYATYPIPPYLYNIKSVLIRKFFAPGNKKTIVVELQAEPWLAHGKFIPPVQQAQFFTTKDLKNYINFFQKTGFDEAYLWGVEWWYFMAENGHPEYLNYAKTLFK